MRRWRLFVSAGVAGLLAMGLLGAEGAGTAGGATFVNWPQYLYSPGHSSGNAAATTITPVNAASLTRAWQFSPGYDRLPVQPGRVRRRHLHRREERLLLRAQRDHRRGHLEAVHRRRAEADLREAGLHLHGHGGPGPNHGQPDDLRLRRHRVPVRDEHRGRHRRVAPGRGRRPVHHGERLLRVELAAGHRRQHLRRDQLAVRRAAGTRRPGRVQPGQRGAGEHALHHAAGFGRREHLVQRGHRRPVDLRHHRQR